MARREVVNAFMRGAYAALPGHRDPPPSDRGRSTPARMTEWLVNAQRDRRLSLDLKTEFNASWRDLPTRRKFGYEVQYGRDGALTLRV